MTKAIEEYLIGAAHSVSEVVVKDSRSSLESDQEFLNQFLQSPKSYEFDSKSDDIIDRLFEERVNSFGAALLIKRIIWECEKNGQDLVFSIGWCKRIFAPAELDNDDLAEFSKKVLTYFSSQELLEILRVLIGDVTEHYEKHYAEENNETLQAISSIAKLLSIRISLQ